MALVYLKGFPTPRIQGKFSLSLSLQHNNGVVEGKVNKLKLIKRMMFGRAGFPLLRQRVLHFL